MKWVTWAVSLCFTLSFSSGILFAESPIITKTVVELDKFEPYEANLFHDSVLWVGQSRHPDFPYVLEVYSQEDKKLASLKIEHAISKIYPLKDHKIMIVGLLFSNKDGLSSHYSIVKWNAEKNKLTLEKTVEFPEDYIVSGFGGTEAEKYFADPGSQRIAKETFWGVKPLPYKVSGPREISAVPGYLVIVEAALGTSNLVSINLKTEKFTRIFKTPRNGLNYLKWIPFTNRFAVSEKGADKLLWFDPITNKVTEEWKVAGAPRASHNVGRCLAVLRQRDRKISFYNLQEKKQTEIAEWDIALPEIENPIGFEINPLDFTVYIRSVLPRIGARVVKVKHVKALELQNLCTK